MSDFANFLLALENRERKRRSLVYVVQPHRASKVCESAWSEAVDEVNLAHPGEQQTEVIMLTHVVSYGIICIVEK